MSSNRIQLRSTDEIPDPYAKIFEEYCLFNGVQSTVFDDVVYKDDSVVVTAPTGSGKTVIFELAIVNLLMHTGLDKNFKIIYMAPVKALCSERFIDWQSKFTPLGLRCSLVTGDTDVDGDVTDLTNLQNMDLVVTTPEKWDFLTRRWRDHQQLMNSVRLFLIDEVHLLNDKSRGHVLEAVVSRMKMIQHQQHSTGRLRFIAVSATVDNTQDIAAWLGSIAEPAISYAFGEEMRPVTLKKVVKGYDLQASGFRFDLNLSYKIEPILKEYSDGKPALIFCSTRKGVLQTAQILSQMVTFRLSVEQQQHINVACEHIVEGKLRDLVRRGLAYHHAGMPQEDRIAVENVFRNGYLPVLIATSTLAMGVNLPAHLVILKNTQFYNQGGYEEYSDNQILQMIGRAGRPQFDSSATAVIMTRPACVERFKRLVSGCDPVRSWLQNQIVEHLNAEIVLCSVRNLDDAVEWLKSTFYWVCAVRQPRKYGLPPDLTPEEIEVKLQEMILKELSQLEAYQLVKLVDNFETKQTPYGRIMARHYVSFDTMKLFLGMSGDETLVQLLDLLTRCAELRDVTLRMHEKRPLNDLNGNNFNRLRFPLPGKIINKHMKINCLIQAVLGGRNLPEYSLLQDSHRTIRVCQRLSRCLYEVTAEKGFMSTQRSAAILAKCIRCQMWEDSPFVSRQLPRIGVALSGLLVAAGKTTLDSLVTANPRDLERILNRFPPMGDEVRKCAASIARLQVQIIRIGNDVLEVRVTRRTLPLFEVGDDYRHWLVLMVGGSDDKLLFQKRFAASDVGFPMENEKTSVSNAALSFNIYLKEPQPTKVHAFLISEMWVGVDSSSTLYLKRNSEQVDDDDMFCDAPGTNTSAQPIKDTPVQASTKSRGSGVAAKTQASKKTAAPKALAPKIIPTKTAEPTLKPPAANNPAVQTTSSDIRRFFPSVQQPRNVIQRNAADCTSQEEEFPEPWRPSESNFEKLQRNKDLLQMSTKQRPSAASPAVINVESPSKTSTFDESVETVASSVTQRYEYDSFVDEGEDRIIDCGFNAFMAEAIKEAENDENCNEDATKGSEIVRPEPRYFGSDLTNMPSSSNRRVPTVNDRYESSRGQDRCYIEHDAPSFTKNSNLGDVSARYLGTSRVSDDSFSTGDHGGSSWSEGSKLEAISTDPHEKKRIHRDKRDDSIVTIDLTHSPRIDSANTASLPKNSDKSVTIKQEKGDLTPTTCPRESLWTDLNKAAAALEISYEIPNQDCSGFAPKTGHLKRTQIDSVPGNSREYENVDTDYSDFTTTTSHKERRWRERTQDDAAVRNSYECENIKEGCNDLAWTKSNRESLWISRTQDGAVPKNSYEYENNNEGCNDLATTMSNRKSPWISRTQGDAVPKNSYEYENINESCNDLATTMSNRESQWISTTQDDAVSKNSYGYQNINESYKNLASLMSNRKSPWMSKTQDDAVPKKSYQYENINEDYSSLNSTVGQSPWTNRRKVNTYPKKFYECKELSIIPKEGCGTFGSTVGYEGMDGPWMTRRKLDAVSGSSPKYKKPIEIPTDELNGFTLIPHRKQPSMDRTMDAIPKNWYDAEQSDEEHSVYTSTIGHTQSPSMVGTKIDAFSKTPDVSKRPTMVNEEHYSVFSPDIGYLESFCRGGARNISNFTTGAECGENGSLIRKASFFKKSHVGDGFKSSSNKPIKKTVLDDSESNLITGGGRYSKGLEDLAPKGFLREIPKWEGRPNTAGHVHDIFPTIDAKLENAMNFRKDNSWYGHSDERSDCFVNTDDNIGQDVWSRFFDDPRDETEEEIMSTSCGMLPMAGTRVAYDELHSTVSVSRNFWQSSSTAPSEDSGLSMNSSQNSIAGIRRRKRDTSVKSIIAELDIPSSPYTTGTYGTDWQGRPETFLRHRAMQAFDDFVLRETSAGQFHFPQTSKIPPSPENQNHSEMSSSYSSLPRTPIRREHEGSFSSHAPQPSTPTPWTTPRLSRLKELSTPSYTLPHIDHVSSSFENVIASAKAEPSTPKRQNMFVSRSSEKRRRLADNSKTAAPTIVQNTEHILTTQSLQNGNDIFHADRTMAESIVHQSDTNPKESFSLKQENLNVKPKSNDEKQDLSYALPQLPQPDKPNPEIGTFQSVTPEKSDPAYSQTIETAFLPSVSEYCEDVASVSDRQPASLREKTELQKPEISTLTISQLSTSPKIPSIDQSVHKPSIMFPPSVFSRETVNKATSQQKSLATPEVFKSRSVQNMVLKNINNISQDSTTSSNGDRAPRVRFKPPLLKSQSAENQK